MIAKPLVLIAGLAFGFPGSALGCDYLTHHFEHCIEGTPWAQGVWEQGGDSATLHLDNIEYEGFEQFIGSDEQTSLRGALDLLLRKTSDRHPERKTVQRDKFSTADLKIVRIIVTDVDYKGQPRINTWMIAQAPDRTRIMLSVRAPIGTDVAEMDRLSRAYAALVKPRTGLEGN
jgi:hypothetical protein